MAKLKTGTNILFEIAEKTKLRVTEQKEANLLEKYKGSSRESNASFKAALQEDSINVIAEFKRASPAEGDIAPHLSSADVAQQYISAGAKAVSVITEPDYFSGKYDYLLKVRNLFSSTPILMKDFIVDKYQIDIAKEIGASAVLLIVSLLERDYLKELYDYAKSKNLDVLVEIHSEQELEEALSVSPEIIGVNNRNLQDMTVDLKTSLDLVSKIPDSIIKVSESGISTNAQILELRKSGYNGFLIGTSLMKSGYPKNALKEILQNELSN